MPSAKKKKISTTPAAKKVTPRKQLPDPGMEMMALASLVLGAAGLLLIVMFVSSYLGAISA